MDIGNTYLADLARTAKNNITRVPAENAAEIPTLLELDSPQPGMTYDYFQVEEFAFDERRQCASLHITVSLINPSPNVKITANIYRDGITSVTSPMVEEAGGTAFLELSRSIEAVTEFTQALEVHVIAEYISGGQKQTLFKIMELQEDARKFAEFDQAYDYRPKKEPACVIFEYDKKGMGFEETEQKAAQGEKKYTVISLFRKPDRVDDCDYICKCSKGPDGYPFVCIPVKGRIFLKKGTFNTSSQRAHITIVKLDPAAAGAQRLMEQSDYNTDINIPSESGTKELTFENHDKFGKTFHEPGGSTAHHFRFKMEVLLSFSIDGSTTKLIPAVITSDPNEETALFNRLQDLSIMWGCMAESTNVLMADGSSRQIKDIHIGDCVMFRGGWSEVLNVWRGPSDGRCVEITGNAGSKQYTIVLTDTHPVLTDQGWQTAGSIGVGSRIVGLKEHIIVASIKKEVSADLVYNLSLSGAHHELIAEGMTVGDFERENQEV